MLCLYVILIVICSCESNCPVTEFSVNMSGPIESILSLYRGQYPVHKILLLKKRNAKRVEEAYVLAEDIVTSHIRTWPRSLPPATCEIIALAEQLLLRGSWDSLLRLLSVWR
ncbi:hypothetical protein FKM82_027361 [Ascaphus truei]